MKISNKSALIDLALTALIAGPAAAHKSGQSIRSAVQSAISSGNLNVSVDNGVATLFGWVETVTERQAAKRAALSFDNVNSIVDLINVSN